MKVLFMANIPSPYRVDFFNELGKYCDLTVTFEGRTATDRDEKWKAAESKNFKAQFMKGIRTKSDQFLCLEIIKVIKNGFDRIIVGGYSTPTAMLAIEYMRLYKIPFWIEADGGLISQDSSLKYRIKHHFVSAASEWLSSGKVTTEYLIHYGAQKERIYEYPFTSLKEKDVALKISDSQEKKYLKEKLGLNGDGIIISVGRFSYLGGYGKGFDVLLKAMKRCPSYGLYIIGDTPTQEFIDMKKEHGLSNVYFEGFKNKDELKKYYRAADLFCLQTRGDVWGLVINEAMAEGLPVITTNKCVAGLELVENGINGYVVPVEDEEKLSEKITEIMQNVELRKKMEQNSLNKIKKYTIENMAKAHIKAFEGEKNVPIGSGK